MQVSVEVTSDLGRRVQVETPSEVVDQQVENRLTSLRSEVKLDGFRPGKVPVSVIRQRFSAQVRSEVLGEMIQSSLQQALVQEKLQPASPPAIESVDEADGNVKFTAAFEILPEIEIQGLDSIQIIKPIASVEDSDLDDMIETLRGQRGTWVDADKAAENKDQVTVNFVGKIDDVVFEGGSAEGIPMELGSGRMIPGFEDQLVGAKAGDAVEVKVDFPADYTKKDLAGKAAVFSVDVVTVASKELPEVDAEFFKTFNIGDGSEESFRQDVRSNMQIELNARLTQKLKDQVMDGLLEANPITVPKTLVDQEAQRLASEISSESGGTTASPEMASVFEDQAKRRVTLGMLLSEIITLSGSKPDEDKVRAKIDELAKSYESPDEVVKWYYGDQAKLSEIQNIVLEEQIVDWVVEKAQVTEEKSTFAELVKPAT